MLFRPIYFIVVSLFALSLLLLTSCEAPGGLSCESSLDCFKGERCVDLICVPEASSPGAEDVDDGPEDVGSGGDEGEADIKIKAVAAGHKHTCALDTEGRVHCWGENAHGQMEPPEGELFEQIVAGIEYTCGLTGAMRAICWGEIEEDPVDALDGEFEYLSGGDFQVCGIGASGELKCWGMSWGDAPGGKWKDVSVGYQHSCSLAYEDGEIHCWGTNYQIELEDIYGSYASVSAGNTHVCVIEESERARCWGMSEAPPAGVFFRDISSGDGYTCGITSEESRLRCWGKQIQARTDYPEGVYKAVSAGGEHACAIKLDGGLECWGRNQEGQIDVPAEFR